MITQRPKREIGNNGRATPMPVGAVEVRPSRRAPPPREALVLELEEIAVHDGPGIRAPVFLKR
ncbi:MAG: hypothetical protein ACOH10_08990 [Rhodoglobus sp.]